MQRKLTSCDIWLYALHKSKAVAAKGRGIMFSTGALAVETKRCVFQIPSENATRIRLIAPG